MRFTPPDPATAAKRSGIVHDRAWAMAAPAEKPTANTRFRSTQVTRPMWSTSADMKARSSTSAASPPGTAHRGPGALPSGVTTTYPRAVPAVARAEYESQMALMNHRLNPRIETVFMTPAEQYTYISSRMIKEVCSLGGQVHGLVPDAVEARLREKFAGRRPADGVKRA